MINKRKLLILLLFSIVLISSVSAISAADSNSTDVQTVSDEDIELEKSNSDIKSIADENIESDQSNLQEALSESDNSIQKEGVKNNTVIIADNITTFPREGKILFKLTDENGSPLEGCNVTLDVKFIHRNFVTNTTGEGYFDINGTGANLEEGNYTGVIKFLGNENYNASSLNISIRIRTLNSTISCDNLTFIYNESGILIACLKDSEGTPIENATLDLVLGNIYDSLKTNASGEVGFNMTRLSVGTYTGNIYFEKTNRYNSSAIPVKVIVRAIPTEINASDMNYTYGDETYLTVTLKDKYGNPLVNESVAFTTSGNPIFEKTNASGQAKFLMMLVPGLYNATVSYSGNETHQSNSTVVHIIVNEIKEKTPVIVYNFTTVYNEGKYITVTLKDDYGNVMANRPFVVNFNGKTGNYNTDAKGQIKLSIASLVPNTYQADIDYLGDYKYRPISFKVNLVVKKAKAYLFASKKKFNAKTSVKKYRVTLKNNKNAVMKKVKLYLKVKGKTYTAKTNNKGQAIFKLKKLNKKGSYKAVITYKGSSCYNEAVKKVKIRVR